MARSGVLTWLHRDLAFSLARGAAGGTGPSAVTVRIAIACLTAISSALEVYPSDGAGTGRWALSDALGHGVGPSREPEWL